MKWEALGVTIILAGLAGAASGEVLYDVDFSAPFHTLGQVCSTDNGPVVRHGPSDVWFGSPTVVDSLGQLTDRPLRFAATGPSGQIAYDQIGFDLSNLPHFDFYSIEMDVELDQLADSPYTSQFTVLFDVPTVRRVDFLYDSTVSVWGVTGVGGFAGVYELGKAVHIRIDVDLGAEQWMVTVGDQPTFTTDLASSQLDAVRVCTGNGAVAGVDNIRIYGIPEPMTLGLLGLGALFMRRRR